MKIKIICDKLLCHSLIDGIFFLSGIQNNGITNSILQLVKYMNLYTYISWIFKIDPLELNF